MLKSFRNGFKQEPTGVAIAEPEGGGEEAFGNAEAGLARLAERGEQIEDEEGEPGGDEGGHNEPEDERGSPLSSFGHLSLVSFGGV